MKSHSTDLYLRLQFVLKWLKHVVSGYNVRPPFDFSEKLNTSIFTMA